MYIQTKRRSTILYVTLSNLHGKEDSHPSPIEQKDEETEQVAVLSFDPLCDAVITGIIIVCQLDVNCFIMYIFRRR